MAFLLLLHEKMRLIRKVNKLTLRQLKASSRKERVTKQIERVQKMYSSRMTRLEKSAQMMQSQATVFIQNKFGLGSQGLNPMNYMGGGTSVFVMNGIAAWAQQAGENCKYKDKDGTEHLTFDGGITPEKMIEVARSGGWVANKDEKGNSVTGAEWKCATDDSITCTQQQYQAYQAGLTQVQQMQSMAQMQAQQMSQNYQNNVSIWLEAQKAQLEAEQDAALAPLEAQETEWDIEKESCDTQLADAKARLESIKQACSEGIKDSAPTFGLG